MKTATLPAVRIEPELRARAESLLAPPETLSSFVEEAVRRRVEQQESQAAFIARGLAAGEEARRTGDYISADAMIARLRARLKYHKGKAQAQVSPDLIPAQMVTRAARTKVTLSSKKPRAPAPA